MIRGLILAELANTPQARTTKTGKPFAIARVSVPQGEGERVYCSVIAFNDDAVARLLQLKAGASVALAGTLKAGVWQTKDGTWRPSLDLVADEAASTTPRPRKPKAQAASAPGGEPGGDPFGDLPGAGDLDWLGA